MDKRTFSFRQRGMMLLEVMIAIVIFAIGVLGMVKMQAVASANSFNAEDRTTAALLANDAIADLWVANAAGTVSSYLSSASYSSWQATVTTQLRTGSAGTITISGASSNVATVKITWPRQLGRNVDFGVSTTDPNATATYITQVVLQ